ncbi:MAG TPA: hypothetical protein VJ836_02435 [Candidatus Saccharimonadales bacterium]|nr:hypothetical protein [Candidatus Saccharimonadales bacterium]
MTSELFQHKQALTELAQTPNIDPEILQTEAWNVLGNVLYESSAENGHLLPGAYNVMQRLADDPGLRARQSDFYFDARIALATWGVFGKLSRHEPITEKTRRTSCRNLGRLLADTTDNTFRLSELAPTVVKKMYEAMTIALLLRNQEQTGVYGLPSPPYTHRLFHPDPTTGTTSFQAYAIKETHWVPMYVSGLWQRHMDDPERHKGVFLVSLGEIAMSRTSEIPTIYKQQRQQGTRPDAQRWLLSIAAEALAQESDGNLSPDKIALLDSTTKRLTRLAMNFDRTTQS